MNNLVEMQKKNEWLVALTAGVGVAGLILGVLVIFLIVPSECAIVTGLLILPLALQCKSGGWEGREGKCVRAAVL